jgi:hypothetical protein
MNMNNNIDRKGHRQMDTEMDKDMDEATGFGHVCTAASR